MKDFCLRVVRRAVPVAVSLAFFGLGFAYLFVLMIEIQLKQPVNDPYIYYRVPTVMAGMGVVLVIVLELFALLLPKKRAKPEGEKDSIPSVFPQPSASEEKEKPAP